jgi:AraC-like DNA-binding protein
MVLEHHIPAFPLSQFVSSFTYYKDFRADHTLDRLLPDGNVTLLVELTGTPQYLYDNETHEEIQMCQDIWFSGVRDTYMTIPSCTNIEMFVVNFQQGMAGPFLKDPLHAYKNHVVDGVLAISNDLRELREKLLDAETVSVKFATAEQFLYRKIRSRMDVNPCVQFAVAKMLETSGTQALSEIVGKVGYSQKHFIQMFKDHVGLTPKSFMRIARFQKALTDTGSPGDLKWTDISFQFGYYDQAQFINDFKNFSGLTPRTYLAMKSAEQNYVPVG